ncbi:MAG: PD-(D/E)XK nuclease family protein, partial [Deltaproteobacteria bacterium]|nr:PD-(D/E)XK nuclease family protein [Deltaproteobacteria bacterium]
HLIFYALKHGELKYFSKLQSTPGLAEIFLDAIRKLKNVCLTPDALEEKLREAGTLKEYDLLQTYRSYEELKQKLGLIDAEDLYPLATQNAGAISLETQEINFENFLEKTPLQEKFLEAIRTSSPQVQLKIQPPRRGDSFLTNTTLLSFRSPLQETNWFLRQLDQLIEIGIPLTEIGILLGCSAKIYEPLWNRLRRLNLVDGDFPFFNQLETKKGHHLFEIARSLPEGEKTITDWNKQLLKNKEARDWEETLEEYSFCETFLPLGKLSRFDFTHWLKNILEERDSPSIKEAITGIQFIHLWENDFTPLKYLWVPRLVEGEFASLQSSPFFKEGRDRGRPEWKELTEAFEDPLASLKKLHLLFQIYLNQAEESWLTLPRLEPRGNDLAPSHLTWFLGKEELLNEEVPFFCKEGEETTEGFETRLQIEKERLEDHYISKEFHANLIDYKLPSGYIFSPTQLEKFAACPFKFYADKILGIPQIKERLPQVDPQDIGTVFHLALERLFSEEQELFLGARTDPEKEKKLFEKCTAILEESFQSMEKELGYAHPELLKNQRQKAAIVAKQLLTKELNEARELKMPMKPAFFEWGFGTETEPSFNLEENPKKEPIYIGGRIDRIDTDPTRKRFLILDYKTGGAVDSLKDKLLNGLSLQLPLYMRAVQKLLLKDYQPAGGLLVKTRTAEKKIGMVDKQYNKEYFNLNRSGALMESEEFEEAMERALEKVKEYAAQIRAGNFEARPHDCNSRCDYKEICRYAYKTIN